VEIVIIERIKMRWRIQSTREEEEEEVQAR